MDTSGVWRKLPKETSSLEQGNEDEMHKWKMDRMHLCVKMTARLLPVSAWQRKVTVCSTRMLGPIWTRTVQELVDLVILAGVRTPHNFTPIVLTGLSSVTLREFWVSGWLTTARKLVINASVRNAVV